MTKQNKPVRGRPEKPDSERRSVLMQFRVTEAEAAAIKQSANKKNLSVSDWLRAKATQSR